MGGILEEAHTRPGDGVGAWEWMGLTHSSAVHLMFQTMAWLVRASPHLSGLSSKNQLLLKRKRGQKLTSEARVRAAVCSAHQQQRLEISFTESSILKTLTKVTPQGKQGERSREFPKAFNTARG